MGPPFLMSPLPGTPIPGQPFPSISIPKDSHPGNSRPCNPPLPATPNPENPHHGDPHSPGPPSDVTPPPQHLQFPGHPSLAPYSPQDSKICQHHVPPHTPPCPHPAPTQGHQHVGTRRDLASCPPPRAQVAPAACDSQPGWPGTAGWPGRWRCSCGPGGTVVSPSLRPPCYTGDPVGTVWGQPHTPCPGCRCPRGATPTQPCPFSLPAQTLGLAGAQTTQLLVQPPWTPPVLWDRVTLTCQGSGTAAATTWYKDGQRWRLQGHDRFVVTESGTYQCDRPGTGRSPPVNVSNACLVLQVPARALLEGDTVTLRCRSWKDNPVSWVSFYREEKQLQLFRDETELSLSPQRLQDSGRYRCRGWVYSEVSWGWIKLESAPVTVTVHKLFPVLVLEGPPEPTEGSPLNLRCLSTPRPLQPQAPLLHLFYRDGRLVGGPQGSPQLLLPAVGVSHSGNYSCQVRSEQGAVRKSSARLRVTVRRVRLSGVSVSAQPPGGQVALGDRLVLSCAVATGTGPLSFSWHRGDSWALLGTGPHLELCHVGDNDSGHYQCRASNGDSVAESVPLNVTVLVPVANATISPSALAQPVCAGDPVTLRCSVQVGSAPVTFTWLRNGREVARGPLLELRDFHVGHSGTYQCVATNQLGQDGHCVFRGLSPELALTVTPRGHWDTGGVTWRRGGAEPPGF
ncbi:Fc receptor-like protein 3 isoform X4 [Corvus hawaiiensis]|uniref:Fc receptor-like protein 3 isoform X4 n=1 Tax=Corvus hawaiiensis TaxID=134902 RepID=UPI002018F5B6|nr:Fc receptor-like protein 3 isoform X4 [Corvus hawaiiensis]